MASCRLAAQDVKKGDGWGQEGSGGVIKLHSGESSNSEIVVGVRESLLSEVDVQRCPVCDK